MKCRNNALNPRYLMPAVITSNVQLIMVHRIFFIISTYHHYAIPVVPVSEDPVSPLCIKNYYLPVPAPMQRQKGQ
ncbi:hypothetical protein GQ43DRAFT_189892 [Delitschia confertaspora ATCC 74209]|uniref:Uncharacterized protein n=1 Tax=Delitschia confertaspora ATCC 74209 TaxID=1513339 RepID=A0A9P4JEK0_9PLEO|nr:hypothetical protein GQ43DRAFT_189892 [Delitschia confertaspora ATCC 74209]